MKILKFDDEKNNIKKKEEIVKLYEGKVVRITFSDKESVGLKESIVEILTNKEWKIILRSIHALKFVEIFRVIIVLIYVLLHTERTLKS